MYSNPDLLVSNLLIGMCRGSLGLPRVIRDLGYRDRWVPRCFPGQGPDSVPPVFAMTSREARHTVFVEVCRGAQIDARQLARYSGVTAAYLRSETSLSREETETYDIAVFGLARHRESLVEGLQEAHLRFPLLLLTRTGLVLAANSFSKAALSKVFFPRLEVPWGTIPRSWIPFNDDSNLLEVADAVIPEVVARALKGETRIAASDLCGSHPLWDILGQPGRDHMKGQVCEALTAATEDEFRSHFGLEGEVLVLPPGRATDSPNRKAGWLRKLLQLQREFLDRLADDRSGRVQRELFEKDQSAAGGGGTSSARMRASSRGSS